VLAELTVGVASAETVLLGLELAAKNPLSGWDALVAQAALQAGFDTLYSEDLQSGRRFGALEVVNPFAAAVQEPARRSRRR